MRTYWWGAAAGVGNGFGTAFLYRGLSSGRMGVVAPVTGVGAAVIPVVVGVRSASVRAAGLGRHRARAAGHLAGRAPARPDHQRRRPEGLLDGALAGLGFGFLFVAFGQISDDAGLRPLVVGQVVAAVVIVVVASLLQLILAT